MPKLNPNAQKWVDALRSGKYKQAKGRLKKGDGHCCLGVGCEVAIENGVIDSYKPDLAGLPDEVQKWLGLKTKDGRYLLRSGAANFLTNDNDSHGQTFADIANIIEENAEGLGVAGLETELAEVGQ